MGFVVQYHDFVSVLNKLVELALAWVLCLSPRSVRNTPTGLCLPSLCSHPPRCRTPSLSLTTPLFPCTSLLRTPTKLWYWTTKPCTISASAPLSSPPRRTVT